MTILASVLMMASMSDATFLRMGAMPVEPKIDNVIERAEESAASTQYGLVSHDNGLMSKRYAVAHVGYTDKGFYFATRTSVPVAPQQLTDEDRVSIALLPPGGKKPFVASKKVSEGRILEGIKDYGVPCAEVELFVPFANLGVAGVADGEKWGLQMTVDFSSERETATWHWNKDRPDELGTLMIDRTAPALSLVRFGMLEGWRQTANYKMAFRVANSTKRQTRMSSDSTIYRGIGFSKLDSEPEANLARETKKVNDLNGLVMAPGKVKMVFHSEWSIWPGTVACLNLDIRADAQTVFKRKFAWDISRGKDWKVSNLPILDFKFFPSYGNRIVMRVSSGGRKDLVRGRIAIVGKKAGKTYWKKDLDTPAAVRYGKYDIALPELPEDDYEITFTSEDKSGKQYEHVRTFQVASFGWQGNSIGKDRVVIPPFKPIRVEDDAVSFLQTGYKAGRGVLWEEICGKGENILAAPVTLKLNGEEFSVTGTKIVEESPDRVVREVTAERGGVRLVVTQDYDYDGFCWVTLAFNAPHPVKVDSLKLEVPMKDRIVRFLDHLKRGDDRWGPAPDISVPQGSGVVWDSHVVLKGKMDKWTKDHYPAKIHPYIYLGGTFKGLAWLIDSVRDLSVTLEKSPQRLVRNGDVLTYEFDIVSVPTVWEGDKRVEMGFQPTPVKPKDPAHGKFTENLYSYDCPSNAVCYMFSSGTVMTPMISEHSNVYPNDDRSLDDYIRAQKRPNKTAYAKVVDDYVNRNRAWLEASRVTTPEAYADKVGLGRRYMWGGLLPRYFDPMIVTCFWPEWEMYKGEWYPEEWTRENCYNEYMCNLCPSRIDKLMSECEVALKNGYDGLYYDCFYSFASACFPQGDAYLRPDGSVQWSLSTIRYWREIMKRSAVLCLKMGKTYNGRPVVELHDTEGSLPMLMSWCMTGLSTERSGGAGVLPKRFPESFTLLNIVGAAVGKGSRFIVKTTEGDNARRNKELISLVAYMCAYGVFSICDQGVIGGNERFFKAWNIPFDFGWGNPDVEQFQYWNEEKAMPVTHTGKNVKLSVGKKKNAALLMFGNLGEEDEDVSFDITGLGLGKHVALVDAESRKPLKEAKVRVPGLEYRMIEVKPCGEVRRIGAINWDAALPKTTFFGRHAANSLGPEKFRDRTPYFAKVVAPGEIEFPERTQADYDREFQYAIDAGIDYFAYCWYDACPPEGSIVKGAAAKADGHTAELVKTRNMHLRSSMRERLSLCAILITAHPYSDAALKDLAIAMKESCYEKIDGRPLVYFFMGDMIEPLGRLRRFCREAGVGEPYAVFMDNFGGSPKEKFAGADALSAYSCSHSATNHQEFFEWCLKDNSKRVKSGKPVIPMFAVGWNPSPRIERPVPWVKYPARTYAPAATEAELVDSAKKLGEWIHANAAACPTGHVLVFAWNEFEEGGWICPNSDTSGKADLGRLKAFRHACRPALLKENCRE